VAGARLSLEETVRGMSLLDVCHVAGFYYAAVPWWIVAAMRDSGVKCAVPLELGQVV
jgi:hypothetical protein